MRSKSQNIAKMKKNSPKFNQKEADIVLKIDPEAFKNHFKV
jgi:hypothetical protein